MNAWYVRGDDPGLVGEAVRSIVHAQSGEDTMAVEDLSDEDVTVGAIVDAVSTPPFLAERRVVVVREVGRYTAEALEPLIQWLKDPLPTTALILTSGGGQVSQRLVNAVKKVGTVVDAAVPQRAREARAWLAERVRESPVGLDPEATDLLARHLGEDMGRLPRLLDTLAAAYGEGARLTVAEVEPFLGEAGGTAPWDLTDAIDRGDTEAALAQLERLLDGGGRHPLVVLATLHRHYAGMLRLDGSGITSETEAAAVLEMAPFPAKKLLQQGRILGSAGVARAITLLAQADLYLRGAQGWPDRLVLEVLVARLCRLARPTRGRSPSPKRVLG